METNKIVAAILAAARVSAMDQHRAADYIAEYQAILSELDRLDKERDPDGMIKSLKEKIAKLKRMAKKKSNAPRT